MERIFWRVMVAMALALTVSMVVSLSGCAVNPTTGKDQIVVPNTPDQALWAAYATLTQVRKTSNDMAVAGRISLGQLADIDMDLKKIRDDLTMAESYFKGGSGWQASRIIDAAMVVMLRIQSELRERQNG